MTVTTTDRIVGCLKGIATGDAIGKQTEMLSHEDVLRWYPHGIRGFEGIPGAIIPRYLGNSKHEWRIGETTDDTERTIAVARAIIAERTVSHATIGREMLRCKKSLHPGAKSLWEFHQAADPMRIASAHDGCGAAIRVAPDLLIEVLEERPGDVAAIRDLNRYAFGQDQEGNIVDALRSNGGALLSLVATLNGRVVGHIMYSRASVGNEVTGAALGPMAVVPEHQRKGIGTKLVEVGNRKLKDAGCPFIIVVGHPRFYSRFGFGPACIHGITCEWKVPDEVFMLLALDDAKMQGVSGLAKYRDEFSNVS